VRQADVREGGEQVFVGPYLILLHLSICKDGKENIDSVVGECSAIVREGRRTRGIIGKDVWQ